MPPGGRAINTPILISPIGVPIARLPCLPSRKGALKRAIVADGAEYRIGRLELVNPRRLRWSTDAGYPEHLVAALPLAVRETSGGMEWFRLP